MSRARITEGVFQPSPSYLIGVEGASVQVNARNAGAAVVYRDETGPTTVANPLTTHQGGIVPVDDPSGDAWLDVGSYDLIVTIGNVSYRSTFEALSGAGGALGSGLTVDTFDEFKLIMFANGDVRAVPVGAVAPAVPTGLAATPRLSSVRVTWNAAPLAARYVLYRSPGGILSEQVTATSFRDLNITPSSTYVYQVQAVDAYGQRSAVSAGVSAFIDPALNVAPTIDVRCWPSVLPTNGRGILRVNARDANAQVLALSLGVDVGTIAPTSDPSVWTYTP